MTTPFARTTKTMTACFLAGLVLSSQTWAAGRNVVINGTRLDNAQLAYLDRAHCMPIPDGDYFLNQVGTDTWAWGYSALPGVVLGYLGEECGRQTQSHGSGSTGASTSFGWSDDYSRTYGGGISAGDGTYEYYDGASGSFIYE